VLSAAPALFFEAEERGRPALISGKFYPSFGLVVVVRTIGVRSHSGTTHSAVEDKGGNDMYVYTLKKGLRNARRSLLYSFLQHDNGGGCSLIAGPSLAFSRLWSCDKD
jgi:hypothetical protein